LLRKLLLFGVLVAVGALVLFVLQRMTALHPEPVERPPEVAGPESTDEGFKAGTEGVTITIWEPGSRISYFCPDHPQCQSRTPGECPVCGNPLVAKPGEATAGRISRIIRARDYRLDPEDPKIYHLTDVTVDDYSGSGSSLRITAGRGLVDSRSRDEQSGWIEDDVQLVAEDTGGTTRLFAQRMEWSQKEGIIRAPGPVRITRDGMGVVTGEDLEAWEGRSPHEKGLTRISIARDVLVVLTGALLGSSEPSEDTGDAPQFETSPATASPDVEGRTSIACEGTLVYRRHADSGERAVDTATFSRNVIVRFNGSSLSARDRLEMDFGKGPREAESDGKLRITRVHATGSVRIESPERRARAQDLTWTRAENLAVLTGQPARVEQETITVTSHEINLHDVIEADRSPSIVVPGEGEMRVAGSLRPTGEGTPPGETFVEWAGSMTYLPAEQKAEFAKDVNGRSSDGTTFGADNVKVTIPPDDEGNVAVNSIEMTGNVRLEEPDRGVRGNTLSYDRADGTVRVQGREGRPAEIFLGERTRIESAAFEYDVQSDRLLATGEGELHYTPQEVPGAPDSAAKIGPINASWTRQFKFDADSRVMTLKGSVVTAIAEPPGGGDAPAASTVYSDELTVEMTGEGGLDEPVAIRRLTAQGNVRFEDKVLGREAKADTWEYEPEIPGVEPEHNLLLGSPAEVRTFGRTEILMRAPEMEFSDKLASLFAAGPGLLRISESPEPGRDAADKPMEIRWETSCRYDAEDQTAVFQGPDVRVEREGGVLSCGRLEVSFVGERVEEIETLIATEGVLFTERPEEGKAEVTAAGRKFTWERRNRKITLEGPGAVVTIDGNPSAAEEFVFAVDESGRIDISSFRSVRGAHVINMGAGFGR